jgi:flagellin
MNSYRNYNTNATVINKNIEKLSSGYKINRAGDDAAGLAISEKMRAQITGLEGAQKNAKDGISLVQTAEGALTEVHSMLNRMYSLAEQSANGTYDKNLDRQQLQKEVDKLREEINRISDSANFNGIKLLDGTQQVRSKFEGEIGWDMGKAIKSVAGSCTETDVTKKAAISELVGGAKVEITWASGSDFAMTAASSITFNGKTLDSAGFALDSNYWVYNASGKIAICEGTVAASSTNKLVYTVNSTKITDTKYVDGSGNLKSSYTATTYLYGKNDGLQLQIGDTADEYNQMKADIGNIHAYKLGLKDCDGQENSIATIDISTQKGAADALAVIKGAINNVSNVRGTLGATQNRLEHTINNLSVMQTNIQDAESTIRDTDVADEMMKYTKNSILVQSAQAMLAQANQQPQGVLQLLQ